MNFIFNYFYFNTRLSSNRHKMNLIPLIKCLLHSTKRQDYRFFGITANVYIRSMTCNPYHLKIDTVYLNTLSYRIFVFREKHLINTFAYHTYLSHFNDVNIIDISTVNHFTFINKVVRRIIPFYAITTCFVVTGYIISSTATKKYRCKVLNFRNLINKQWNIRIFQIPVSPFFESFVRFRSLLFPNKT